MGNTNKKEHQDINRVNKPKRRRTRPVVRSNAIDNRSDPLPSHADPDAHQQKDPLTTQQTSDKQDFRETVSSIGSDQRTSVVLLQNNSSPSLALQLPLSKSGPRKFAPSFLATSVGLDRAPPVVSNIIVEPGKRWYDHNYESKVEPLVLKYS